jgi:hypothetical protein
MKQIPKQKTVGPAWPGLIHKTQILISKLKLSSFLLVVPLSILLLATTNVCATQVLSNRGFESGSSGWIGYSPVTWGNYGVNSDYNCTAGGSKAFWVRGAWNWPQPNLMGNYQNLVSAPGCVYQASGSIYSPSGYGTRGDTTLGDFGWIGIDGNQNYAWLEVSFRDPTGTILALYKSAVFDSTSPQSTWVVSPITNVCDIGNNYAVTGSVSTLEAPAGTTIVRFQTVFEQANWNHGAAWFDELSLNQTAGPVPPSIANITPNGTSLFNTVNAFTFNVSSATTDINPSGIHVTANGLDVSSQLSIGGTARDRNVSLTLKSNQVYSISITVTDVVNFAASATALFDTFQPTYYMVECEDYDFNGGQFIDNPVLSSTVKEGSYFGQAGVGGIDYLETANGSGDHIYRPSDQMATTYANGDLARDKFVQAQATDPAVADFKTGWFDGGEWLNFTRTYPAGKFNVYLRAAGGAGQAKVDLSRVISGQGTTEQATTLLGSFSFLGRGWSTFDWVPLTDTYGNLVAVDLGGLGTLRVTTHGGADVNFLMLVPAQLDRPAISNFYPDGTKLFQPTNQFVFKASSPSTTIPAANIMLVLNGVNVSSQLTITGTSTSKSAVLNGLTANRAYTAAITVTDANGNVATSTVDFDTFTPVALFEGEDWDFSGGQFINSPVLSSTENSNSYYNKVGVQSIDENETANGGAGDGPAGDHAFRPSDVMAAGLANDVPRQNFIDAQAGDANIKDYSTGWFTSGEWVNYTRNLPAGTYNVIGRVASGTAGATAYVDLVTSGQGTSDQHTTRLGGVQALGRGWSSYDFAPLRDKFGNLAVVTLAGGQTTLRVTDGSAGDVNLNFLMLVPARTDLPSITGVYPDGATLLQGTNAFAFTAANPTYAIDLSAIKVTLNGIDVSSQLNVTGTANSRNVSLAIVPNFVHYTAVITVTDANTNVATTTVYFDTFSPSSFTWEAEDYDFQNGQFIDNPDFGAYGPQAGVNGSDYYMDTANPPAGATYLYRTADLIATEVCTDTPLPKFATAQATNPTLRNYDVGWWLGGQWMNFTRTYPAGDYLIYGRLSGNGIFNVNCQKVTPGATNELGVFTAHARGWALYDWVPLTDSNGNKSVVALGGVTTLRATSDGNANANSFVLVPATAAPTPVQLIATQTGGNIALSFSTLTGLNYKVYYKNALSDSGWTLLTMVAGDGSVKSITDVISGSSRFYRLQIQ